MNNFWLNRKGQRETIREINRILKKFIGYSINPLDALFFDMRNEILVYFQKHQDKLKYFTNGVDPFDYNFEVDETNDIVTKVVFTLDT